MKKTIAIVGPTGVGKTQKALELSLVSPSIIISADSRQVYRGMDIVTGKDHPKNVQIYGVDLVDPDEDCSVSVWYDSVIVHANEAWQNGQQVILVGGTGLYVKAFTGGIATMSIPINPQLRTQLDSLPITSLQAELSQLDADRYASMNHSDQNNSRRLIRAIEVAIHVNKVPNLVKQSSELVDHQTVILGLRHSDDRVQRNKIYERVVSRLELGAIEETKLLLSKYNPGLKSMTAIGYRSIVKYLSGELAYEDLISTWVEGEMAYVKRQLTWFRKQPVIWYDMA